MALRYLREQESRPIYTRLKSPKPVPACDFCGRVSRDGVFWSIRQTRGDETAQLTMCEKCYLDRYRSDWMDAVVSGRLDDLFGVAEK